MKLKDSEKSILLVLAGIAILVVSFLYVMKPNYESTQAIEQECVALRERLNYLMAKDAQREEFKKGAEDYEKAFAEKMDEFAPDLNQEVTVMFLQGIKDDNDFGIENVSLGQPEEFYTLGLNGADASLGTTDAAATDAAATTEAASTEAATTQAASTGLVEGEAAAPENAYVCYRADFPLSYRGTYESLKDVIDYVNNFDYRMTINSIDIAYAGGEADEYAYSGNIDLKCYAIMSADRPESSMEMEDVETGVDNIFVGEGGGSASNDNSLTKYDENDGAAIVNNYDFYAMLNASTSDVSAKVVGQNGTGKEASVISNSDNNISTLTYDFYESEGKNYCKYTLDGTEYEAEVTSAEDIKILLQSSARKDEEDKVGIKVTIRNSTSLPVYVKISGDDAVSARVKIASKTGSVKVY